MRISAADDPCMHQPHVHVAFFLVALGQLGNKCTISDGGDMQEMARLCELAPVVKEGRIHATHLVRVFSCILKDL